MTEKQLIQNMNEAKRRLGDKFCVPISKKVFNAMRRHAGYSGPITMTEIQSVNGAFCDGFPFEVVMVATETLDAYRQRYGYSGKMTKHERKWMIREVKNESDLLPQGVPTFAAVVKSDTD